MWPAQHGHQYYQPEAGLMLVVPPQQPEQQSVQPAMHQQTHGAHVIQHPLDMQQHSLQAQLQQQVSHQHMTQALQQPAQQPQTVAGYGQPAPVWQQQQQPSAGRRIIPHVRGMPAAVTPLPPVDTTASWQHQHLMQQALPQHMTNAPTSAQQHQQYVQQVQAVPQAQSVHQAQDSTASEWQQHRLYHQAHQQTPAAAPQWHHQQQYEPQQQQLHQQTMPPAARHAPVAASVAASGGFWRQHQYQQLPQQHQPAGSPNRYPAGLAAAGISVDVPPQPMRPAMAQHSDHRQQKQRPQLQEGQRRQKKQRQTPARDFDFEQWQQQSSKWRTQGRQLREAEQQQQQQRSKVQKQQKHQGHKPPVQQQKQQHGSKQQSHQQKQQLLQGHDSGHSLKQQGQQQQQQAQESLHQQQPVKLSKTQRRARNKLLLQQQQSQQQTEQLEPFPLMKLPPRLIANIAALLPQPQQLRLAELLPQASAAAAAIWGSISTLNIGKNKSFRLPDVPEYVARMRGLQQLTARVWMTGSIQTRTGLAALSSLTLLTQLELVVDVEPELKVTAAKKPQQANQQQSSHPKRRKSGAEAPPLPSLIQQLDEHLLNPAVKIQEDFWQITSAVGKLTNLQVLNLVCCNNSNGHSKRLFKQLGYQSLAPLSCLTSLVSLHIKYSVCQAGAGLACLSGLTGITSLSLEEEGGVEITDGEPGVASLSGFWQNAVQLQQLLLRTPYLGPDVVRQLGLKAEGLRSLSVSGCKGLFPSFRTWGHLRRLQGLQELHASNCIGITAADLETVASALASTLTYLDISWNTAQSDGGDLRGSIDALGRLTNLQHLNAFGSCIAPVGDGSEGGVCSILGQLTQLTFLSVGCVHRSVMVMPSADVAQLSLLTGLRKLQLAGAQLGVGLDRNADLNVLLSRLEFLKPLTQLSLVRLWACRFSKFRHGHVSEVLRTQVLQHRRLPKKNCTVLDSKWYPDKVNAEHQEPADYSGDEGGRPTAATADGDRMADSS